MVAESVIETMDPQGASIPSRHLGHDGLAFRRTLETKDRPGEVEPALHRPDALVLLGREDLRRITHRDPADRHGGAGRHDGVHVHDPVDPHLGAAPDARPVEHACSGGDEDRIIYGAPREVGVRTHQDVIAESKAMPPGPPQHGVLHDDAIPADGDGSTLGNEHGAEQHTALGADDHVTADGGGGSDIRGLVDTRALTSMLAQDGWMLPSPHGTALTAPTRR